MRFGSLTNASKTARCMYGTASSLRNLSFLHLNLSKYPQFGKGHPAHWAKTWTVPRSTARSDPQTNTAPADAGPVEVRCRAIALSDGKQGGGWRQLKVGKPEEEWGWWCARRNRQNWQIGHRFCHFAGCKGPRRCQVAGTPCGTVWPPMGYDPMHAIPCAWPNGPGRPHLSVESHRRLKSHSWRICPSGRNGNNSWPMPIRPSILGNF